MRNGRDRCGRSHVAAFEIAGDIKFGKDDLSPNAIVGDAAGADELIDFGRADPNPPRSFVHSHWRTFVLSTAEPQERGRHHETRSLDSEPFRVVQITIVLCIYKVNGIFAV